jgi:hypothetical protein
MKPCRVDDCLRRLWMKDLILRTRKPTFEFEVCHRGRAGSIAHNRTVNYYVVKGKEIGSQFVGYEDRMKDDRNRDVESKTIKIVNFLKKNMGEAFYSLDVVKALEIKSCYVMPNVRRYEKKGSLFVRGYQSHDQRSPFKKGYIMTLVDQSLPRNQAVKEAF